MNQIQSIQVILDDGKTITLRPQYKSKEEFDPEFLFNGPDNTRMKMHIDKANRRAEFIIEGDIATDRITMV